MHFLHIVKCCLSDLVFYTILNLTNDPSNEQSDSVLPRSQPSRELALDTLPVGAGVVLTLPVRNTSAYYKLMIFTALRDPNISSHILTDI